MHVYQAQSRRDLVRLEAACTHLQVQYWVPLTAGPLVRSHVSDCKRGQPDSRRLVASLASVLLDVAGLEMHLSAASVHRALIAILYSLAGSSFAPSSDLPASHKTGPCWHHAQ